MNCQNCGTPLRDDAKFCPQCGTPVTPASNEIPKIQPQSFQGQQPTYTTQKPLYQNPPAYAGQQPNQVPPRPVVEQKQTVVVRKMPILVIIVLTIGFIISAGFMEDAGMTIAMAVSSVPGVVLLFLIYRLDSIEPEPVNLLVKLFLAGGFLATIAAILIEMVVGGVIGIFFAEDTILFCFAQAFIMAAAVEELCKYTVLKFLTWKHPAFNFRFDGVVYSTAVAIGFEVIENLLYIADSTAGTAFTRAAFPGHCVFGIYMGYYYGQAKSLELSGDIKGAKAMRRKGVITAIIIHGFYDFVCFLSGVSSMEFLQVLLSIALVIIMVVLNVTAYKNIKKYAFEDKPV